MRVKYEAEANRLTELSMDMRAVKENEKENAVLIPSFGSALLSKQQYPFLSPDL